MRSAPVLLSSNPRRTAILRRSGTLLLVIAIHVLLLVMLLTLAPHQQRPDKAEAKPLTFQLMPNSRVEATRAKAAARAERASGAAPRREAVPKPQPAEAPVPAEPVPPLQLIPLTRAELDASDISRLGSRRSDHAASGEGTAGSGTGTQSGAAAGPGEGPGGEQLYNADWYRKPTRAELSYYLPPNAPRLGWAMIACQTVADYHVENCRELGQSPAGSGLARAMRQAAWQFRVVPPRLGGRPMIGAWVRIRIDFVEGDVQ